MIDDLRLTAKVQIGKDIVVDLLDTSAGTTANILASYDGNVKELVRQYNSAMWNELSAIGDDLKRKLMLEIGTYINGRNKIATKRLWNSIYKRMKPYHVGDKTIQLEVGSTHPMIDAILHGQGKLGIPSPRSGNDDQLYSVGGSASFEQNMKTWISKKRIAFYYWYDSPKTGRKLKRMDKSRTLFLLMRSIGKYGGKDRKYHQGVLPSYMRYQKTSLPIVTSSKGKITTTRRPSKSEYYNRRSSRVMLEETFANIMPEIKNRLDKVGSSFSGT